MQIQIVDVWQDNESDVGMRYQATFPGMKPIEGTIVQAAGKDEVDYLNRALPLIRSRHKSGPVVAGLNKIRQDGEPIDDNEDPPAKPDQNAGGGEA